MPRAQRKPNKCEKAVKAVVPAHLHSKCAKTKHAVTLLKGKTILRFARVQCCPPDFNENQEYAVCKTLKISVEKYLRENPEAAVLKGGQVEEDGGGKIGSLGGEEGSAAASLENAPTPPNIESPSRSVAIGSQVEELTTDTTVLTGSAKKRQKVGHIKKFVSDVQEINKKYRLTFRQLMNRQRVDRIQDICKHVVAACADSAKLASDGSDYIKSDVDLRTDVLMVLDGMRARLEKELSCNFDLDSTVTPSPEEVSEQNAPVGPGVDTSLFPKEKFNDTDGKYSTAVSMLGELTLNGYKRVSEKIRKQFKIPSEWMPSFYKLTKNRPAVEKLTLLPKETVLINSEPAPLIASGAELVNQLADVGLFVEDSDLDINATEVAREAPTPHDSSSNIDVNSFIGKNLSIEDCLTELKVSRSTDSFEGAKIAGTYNDYMKLMVKTHKEKGRTLDRGKIMVLDSYDGAEHSRTEKTNTNVVSFSSKIVSSGTIKSGLTTGKSMDILTWQQIKCDEKLSTMLPALTDVFQNRAEMIQNNAHKQISDGSEFCFYDLHDGKMLYLLTQHSLFNRKNKPFLLCSCQRGEAIEDGHKCQITSDAETIRLWKRSLHRWNDKRSRLKEGERWEKKEHMDWIDNKNNGISHFGIYPKYLLPSRIRFDVFHLRCAVTRRMMVYTRTFIQRGPARLVSSFSDLLLTFMTEYNVLLWNMKKPFSKLKGNELLSFINGTEVIVKWLRSKYANTDELKNLCDALELWEKISRFLVITLIDNVDDYKKKLEEWEAMLGKFYKAGRTTFLTKNPENEGDDETFYLHVLRCYLPKIAKQTLEDFNLGLGVFTMQGFERRNKESKHTLKRFSNKIGNVLQANLRRLWDIYFHETTAM